MISSETPVLFAKACEIFIVELTYRAWAFTLDSKRRTLQVSVRAILEKRCFGLYLQYGNIRFFDRHNSKRGSEKFEEITGIRYV